MGTLLWWLLLTGTIMVTLVCLAEVGQAAPLILTKKYSEDTRCILCGPGGCPTCYLPDANGVCRPIFGCQSYHVGSLTLVSGSSANELDLNPVSPDRT